MKLLSSNAPTEKEVEYFGVKLIVPVDAKWIATDESGYAYSSSSKNKPFLTDSFDGMIWKGSDWVQVAKFYRNGVEPKDTLREV